MLNHSKVVFILWCAGEMPRKKTIIVFAGSIHSLSTRVRLLVVKEIVHVWNETKWIEEFWVDSICSSPSKKKKVNFQEQKPIIIRIFLLNTVYILRWDVHENFKQLGRWYHRLRIYIFKWLASCIHFIIKRWCMQMRRKVIHVILSSTRVVRSIKKHFLTILGCCW